MGHSDDPTSRHHVLLVTMNIKKHLFYNFTEIRLVKTFDIHDRKSIKLTDIKLGL